MEKGKKSKRVRKSKKQIAVKQNRTSVETVCTRVGTNSKSPRGRIDKKKRKKQLKRIQVRHRSAKAKFECFISFKVSF